MKKLLLTILLIGLFLIPGVSVATTIPFDTQVSKSTEVYSFSIPAETRLIKSVEHDEIFAINEKGEKSWIENWWTFVYVAQQMGVTWNELLAQVEIMDFKELRDNYPIGSTWLKKTVTNISDGQPVRDIFQPEFPPVTIRQWVIAGTAMDRPDWYSTLGYIGFTHIYSNKGCGLDWDELEEQNVKVIMTITGEDENEWRRVIRENKDKSVIGGYWHDDLGHEPDLLNPEIWESRLVLRKRFYEVVREEDPDIQNHPVMEMMNNTAWGDFLYPDGSSVYPGWKLAFNEDTHDILLVDIYPDQSNAADMIAAMERSWNKFIKVFPHENQVIIQMIANGNNYWNGYIRTQYEFWKEKMSSSEFNNPYNGIIGVAWYKQELWMTGEEIQEEMKEVANKVKGG